MATELRSKILKRGRELKVWPMESEIEARDALKKFDILHLEAKWEQHRELFPESKQEGYALSKGKTTSISDLREVLKRTQLMKEALVEGSILDKWMSDTVLDWTFEYLDDLTKWDHVRVFSVSAYSTLLRRQRELRKISKTLQRPTANVADQILGHRDLLSVDISRKVQGARAFCTLEAANKVARMSKVTGAKTLPVLNDDDRVYSAVICKLIDNHFSFVVVDAERAQYVQRPVLVYFDSMGSTITPHEDATLISLANIAKMESAPIHFALAQDQKKDTWSCGYRAVIRLKQVVRWLANNRRFDTENEKLYSEKPLRDSGAGFLSSIGEDECKNVLDDIHDRTVVAYLFLLFRQNQRQGESSDVEDESSEVIVLS